MADPVALGNQYKSEFESTLEGLRQRGTALQASIQAQIEQGPSAIEPLKQELLESVQDQSDVVTPPGTVMNTFAWNSVLVLGASAGFYVGANVLGGFVHLFVAGFAIAVLALGLAPAYVYYSLKNPQGESSDSALRMFLLAYAVSNGVLLGGAFNATYITSEPLAVLAPLIVTLVFAYGAPALGSDRTKLLGASVGGGLGLFLIAGVVTGSLSAAYLTLSLLYSGATFVTLQFLFKNIKGAEPAHLYMFAYVTAYFYVKGLSFFLFGSSEPPVTEDK